ncbi:hypothetical protein I79_012183 [Cricetulus griseus]|uniref:Uncharacterized protein n=1 Tax=Cricetulus griseus TaxID=10029 RepID=G3HN51_CRIGR|nr:hypothetical protein I79_012183 [Cricetulus griseus]
MQLCGSILPQLSGSMLPASTWKTGCLRALCPHGEHIRTATNVSPLSGKRSKCPSRAFSKQKGR